MARQHLTKAQAVLQQWSNPDPAAVVQVLYQLMNVEFETAFSRDLTAEGKIIRLNKAEQYGWEASEYAKRSTNPGDSAQVRLYMAVIKGRKAEIHARLGVFDQDIRKQKDEALTEIFLAMEELQQSGRPDLPQSVEWSNTWTKRLQTPPTEVQANIITPSIPELGTSYALF